MRRAVVLGVVIAAVPSLGAPVAVPAKGRPKAPRKPDLKITRWEDDLGGIPGRPWSEVNPTGNMLPVTVHLTITNQGTARAGASTGEVVIQDFNGRRFPKLFHVPALNPGKRFRKTVTIANIRPRLGEASIEGIVDARNQIKESDEGNNIAPTSGDRLSTSHQGETFPIVPREWDVSTFTTDTTGSIADVFTSARSDFTFELSTFDGKHFNYLARGPVDNHADQKGFCTGTSNETRTHRPWNHSGLTIDYDLGHYDATVDSGAETYTITISCPFIGSHTEQHQFGALDTFAGEGVRPTMQPGTDKLFGQTTDSSIGTTWTWDFRAKVR